ncbi:hypothetical protein DNU06_16135 [Putridiphycobacter roseus]|uniref:Chromosome partitioning protein ParA n=1 Tax=Putridiphycobacter roseus TaxID=2219161 RepID=A0A2W1MXA9_9FLAO|nr:hypothetical protein [Putridiphycobacter roseus]PZE15800.1 hypothetical protein DNU06_16135 [Putridiphycobacter roseus]
MSEITEYQEKSKKNGLYLLIIIALLLLSGFLGWKLSSKNKTINELTFQNKELSSERDEMSELLYDQGLAAGEDLKENLQNMLADYETMEALNTNLNDSILREKDKIVNLLGELEKEKGNKKYYARKVFKLEKETETLRSIMKDYVRTIDSLNTENLTLRTDLTNTRNDLTTVIQDRDDLQSKAETLSRQVSEGAKLSALSIVSEGIRERNTGSYKETDRASRATHIRSCFTIAANKISEAGNKTVYMRVLDQNGNVLYSSNGNSFATEGGKSMVYSDKKTINYQKEVIDVCIFYKLTSEIEKGNYTAELWCEGAKIGKNSFTLK